MMSDHYHEMREALGRQAEQAAISRQVDRRGWTDVQWIEDARELMSHTDGAITSLVNGHVLALLRTEKALREANVWQAERIRALNKVVNDIEPAKLRALAAYVEMAYPSPHTHVQDDLRRWADLVEKARDR